MNLNPPQSSGKSINPLLLPNTTLAPKQLTSITSLGRTTQPLQSLTHPRVDNASIPIESPRHGTADDTSIIKTEITQLSTTNDENKISIETSLNNLSLSAIDNNDVESNNTIETPLPSASIWTIEHPTILQSPSSPPIDTPIITSPTEPNDDDLSWLQPKPSHNVINAPIVFESKKHYQNHFLQLVQIERDADQAATAKSIEQLQIQWVTTRHHISGLQNLTAIFQLSHKERSEYKFARASRVIIVHPSIPFPISGFIHDISYRSDNITVMIDPSSTAEIKHNFLTYPQSGYTLSFVFDSSVYKRMEASLEALRMDPKLLTSFLGHPLSEMSRVTGIDLSKAKTTSPSSSNSKKQQHDDSGSTTTVNNSPRGGNMFTNLLKSKLTSTIANSAANTTTTTNNPSSPSSPSSLLNDHLDDIDISTNDTTNQQTTLSTLAANLIENDYIIHPDYLPIEYTPAPGVGNNALNQSQQDAVKMALTTPTRIGVTIGPPGSGKTTVVTATVYHLHASLYRQYNDRLKKFDQMRGNVDPYDFDAFITKTKNPPILPTKPGPILVSAPSNVAVDHIASLLVKIPGLNVLRISSKRYKALKFAAVDDAVENCALHKRIEAWLMMNPSSELGLLHNRIFGGIDDDQKQTLVAKLDSVLNDDSVLTSHLDYTNRLQDEAMRDNGDDDDDYYYNTDDDGDDDDDDDDDDVHTKKTNDKIPKLDDHHADKQFTERLLASLDKSSKSLQSISQGELTLWRKLYLQLQTTIIQSADVVCITFSLAGNPLLLGNITFSHVILDEVSQSTEPQLILPLSYNPKHLVLFGDAHQLPPIVQSPEALTLGLDRSLFCRLLTTRTCSITMLNTQYRMHPAISHFSSQHFYKNLLLDGMNTITHHQYKNKFAWPNNNIPICWLSSYVPNNNIVIDNYMLSSSTSNNNNNNNNNNKNNSNIVNTKEQRVGTSIINNYECLLIEQILILLLTQRIPLRSIGIVIPYKGQSRNLLTLLCDPNRPVVQIIYQLYFQKKNYKNNNNYNNKNNNNSLDHDKRHYTIDDAIRLIEERLEIESVDSFQGREMPIIIFGCVRTSRQIGFLNDLRRLNVGLTRAQQAMIVVGDHNALDQGTWGHLIQYYRQNNAFVQNSAEFLQSQLNTLLHNNNNNNSDNKDIDLKNLLGSTMIVSSPNDGYNSEMRKKKTNVTTTTTTQHNNNNNNNNNNNHNKTFNSANNKTIIGAKNNKSQNNNSQKQTKTTGKPQ